MGGTLAGVARSARPHRGSSAPRLCEARSSRARLYHGYDATDLFEYRASPRHQGGGASSLLADAHARAPRAARLRPEPLVVGAPHLRSTRRPTARARTRAGTGSSAGRTATTSSSLRTPCRSSTCSTRARAAHVLEAAAHWLELGVDGYRVDHATGPAQAFWAHFRQATRSARADALTFGEAVETPARERDFEGLIDGCLDFTLLEAFRKTFAESTWDGVRFWRFLDAHSRYFPPDFVRPSFLDNHDMNRFLWVAGNDERRLRLAALCQFTLEGPPVVYYGTELGMSQVRDVRETSDREARRPMAWDDANEELLDFYRGLIGLRRRAPEVWSQGREALAVETDLLVYRVGDRVTVALNLAERERTFEGTKLAPLAARSWTSTERSTRGSRDVRRRGQDLRRRNPRRQRPEPRGARRRVPRPRRPVGLRQDDGAADGRRARGDHRRRRFDRRPRRQRPRRRRSATSRWSSRTTRSTRT